jgi:hypothetical protein
MLVTLGRLLLVLTLLANTRGNFCARPHPQSPPTPVKQRYISLALAYRQQILESIEKPALIETDFPRSNIAALTTCTWDQVQELTGPMLPGGDPLYLLMSLQL